MGKPASLALCIFLAGSLVSLVAADSCPANDCPVTIPSTCSSVCPNCVYTCTCTPTPKETACAGFNCGTVPDGCGGSYSCSPDPTKADCDDSNKCTTDTCNNNVCSYTPTLADCDDSNACTTDSCNNNACSNTLIYGCGCAAEGTACTAQGITGTCKAVPADTDIDLGPSSDCGPSSAIGCSNCIAPPTAPGLCTRLTPTGNTCAGGECVCFKPKAGKTPTCTKPNDLILGTYVIGGFGSGCNESQCNAIAQGVCCPTSCPATGRKLSWME